MILKDAYELDIKQKLGYAMRLRSRGVSERDAANKAHIGRQQIRRFVKIKVFFACFFALSLPKLFCCNIFFLLQCCHSP